MSDLTFSIKIEFKTATPLKMGRKHGFVLCGFNEGYKIVVTIFTSLKRRQYFQCFVRYFFFYLILILCFFFFIEYCKLLIFSNIAYHYKAIIQNPKKPLTCKTYGQFLFNFKSGTKYQNQQSMVILKTIMNTWFL